MRRFEDSDLLAGGQRDLASGGVIFILLLVNRRDLMGDYVNTVTFNIVRG